MVLGFHASSATGATTVGQTFAPDVSCGTPNIDYIQSTGPTGGPSFAAPSGGVITSWSHQAPGAADQLRLKVARAAGGDNFTIVGQSALETMTPSTLNTFGTRIPVQAGDVIGFFHGSGGLCATGAPGGIVHFSGGDTQPGTTAPFTPSPGFKLDVSAQLEPDADNDGFGDETQDQCPGVPQFQTLPCDRAAPETTITKGPKARTEKPKAKFKFQSSEANSSFQCRLKGRGLEPAVKQFAPCTSPRKYKGLDRGKYRFVVFATDATGNPDSTPAKHKFRVIE
jgi:hypothetical protein